MIVEVLSGIDGDSVHIRVQMLSGAPVVLCGPNGAFNLAAHVSSGAINEVRKGRQQQGWDSEG